MNISKYLPIGGIVAFSLMSAYSIYQMLWTHSEHPTQAFVIPALAIELVTAWLVYQVVSQLRDVTRSNVTKQDRRFALIMFALTLALALPTLAASVVANVAEFGDLLLGLLFPVCSVTCAVALALPDMRARYASVRKAEASERQAARKTREAARKAEAKRAQRLANLGKARATYEQLAVNPDASQAQIAEALGISRQAVGQHVQKIREAGLTIEHATGNGRG